MQEYHHTWQQMKALTDERNESSQDELWFCEHPPVFTQGLAGKPEHILQASNIPIVQTDRGGQVTYHGPGQLMIYTMFDLKRLQIGPREFVCLLEQSIIDFLSSLGINAKGRRDAPGVYVANSKICSIGLRIRRGCSYHGLALNVCMDTLPFKQINPCGFKGLAMTQIAEYTAADINSVQNALVPFFQRNFGYKNCITK